MRRSWITLATSAAPAETAELDLRYYWRLVVRNRWTIVLVAAVTTAAVAAYTFVRTPVYRATALVEVQPKARNLNLGADVSGLGAAGYGWFAEEKYQNTQLEIIRSRDVGERAFRALKLDLDDRFRELEDPAGTFISRIQVRSRRDTGLIEISFEGEDPHEVARWANAVADAYVARNLEQAKQSARVAVASIERLMDPLRSRLTEAEKGRFEFLKETARLNPTEQKAIVAQTLQRLQQQLGDARVRLKDLATLLDRVEEVKKSGGDLLAIPEIGGDPVLREWEAVRLTLAQDLEKLRAKYGNRHPEYREKLADMAALEKRIRERTDTLVERFRTDYELVREHEQHLLAEIDRTQELAYGLEVATSRYEFEAVDAETQKRIYDAMIKAVNEVALNAELLVNNVSVLDYAMPPRRPVKPNKRLNLALGAVVGLLLGLGTVLLIDYLDNTLRTPEDVERYAGLYTLAVVPKGGEAASSRALKEAYQTLRTSLMFVSRDRQRRVLLVTSAGPQEGKSTTTVELARALRGSGEKVLVIDCDLRRPAIHRLLGVSREPGLTNWFVGTAGAREWRRVVRTDSASGVDAIVSGPLPPNPPDLLGSERFRSLIEEVRAEYDWVLLDSPPCLSLADASILADAAGTVLLVIRHNKTDRDMVRSAVAKLHKVGASFAGAVLNAAEARRAYGYDYYYAGYYYYGSGEEAAETKRRVAESGRG